VSTEPCGCVVEDLPNGYERVTYCRWCKHRNRLWHAFYAIGNVLVAYESLIASGWAPPEEAARLRRIEAAAREVDMDILKLECPCCQDEVPEKKWVADTEELRDALGYRAKEAAK
jgi:hypothetical protein